MAFGNFTNEIDNKVYVYCINQISILEIAEIVLDPNATPKQRMRQLDHVLGQIYRTDPRANGISFSEYKEKYLESIKDKKLKTRYSMYEPYPGENAINFKKRMRTITLAVPSETNEEFNVRMEKIFNR